MKFYMILLNYSRNVYIIDLNIYHVDPTATFMSVQLDIIKLSIQKSNKGCQKTKHTEKTKVSK